MVRVVFNGKEVVLPGARGPWIPLVELRERCAVDRRFLIGATLHPTRKCPKYFRKNLDDTHVERDFFPKRYDCLRYALRLWPLCLPSPLSHKNFDSATLEFVAFFGTCVKFSTAVAVSRLQSRIVDARAVAFTFGIPRRCPFPSRLPHPFCLSYVDQEVALPDAIIGGGEFFFTRASRSLRLLVRDLDQSRDSFLLRLLRFSAIYLQNVFGRMAHLREDTCKSANIPLIPQENVIQRNIYKHFPRAISSIIYICSSNTPSAYPPPPPTSSSSIPVYLKSLWHPFPWIRLEDIMPIAEDAIDSGEGDTAGAASSEISAAVSGGGQSK